MHPADTSTIDEMLTAYHQSYRTYYAFYEDVDGVIGDHEEAILREQMEDSVLSGLMEDALPSNTAPEEVSAEIFYGPWYFWPKRTLIYEREPTTKRPMPIYRSDTNKAFTQEEYSVLKEYWVSIGRDADGTPENTDRQGYSVMFQLATMRDFPSRELNACFHALERFMCDDIRQCRILDWRADLAPHCRQEHEYGACEGSYLWTLSCPVKRRLTLIRWHWNWYYA